MESCRAEGLSPAAAAVFKSLQRRFIAGLPARWAEIRSARDAPSLRAALHRLRGSAGSFGFERLGQCAGALELLEAQAGGPGMEQQLARLEREIHRLQALGTEDQEGGPA